MRITTVRHTSVDVPKGICYGKSDVPLASSFETECALVSDKLGSALFDAVFSGPLSRCTILATELAKKLPIHTDNRLIELDFGDWEMADWNSIYESAASKSWFADYVNTRCPNGESFADQIERTGSFLADLNKEPFNHTLVVTHAGIIRAMMCLLQDKSPEEAFNTPLEYGQVLTFKLENHG